MKLSAALPHVYVEPENRSEEDYIRHNSWFMWHQDAYRCYWTRVLSSMVPDGIIITPRSKKDVLCLKQAVAYSRDIAALDGTIRDEEILNLFAKEYKPRQYQLHGIKYMVAVGRVILADQTGLGKTIQSAGAAVYSMRHGQTKTTTLVVCPAGLRGQWRNELVKMFVDVDGNYLFSGTNVTVIDGSPAQRRQIYSRTPTDFVIVNYEIFLRDQKEIIEYLQKMKIGTIIFDESSRFKSSQSQTFNNVRRLLLALSPSHVFCLNATPLENNLSDLWAQLAIVEPSIFPSFNDFENRYVLKREIPIRGTRRTFTKIVGHRNLEEVKSLIRDCYVRRTYAMVSEQLPDVIVARREVEISKIESDEYTKIKNDSNLDPLARVGALVRASLYHLDANGIFTSSKLSVLMDVLEEIGDEKVVIATEWAGYAAYVHSMLQKDGRKAALICGETPQTKREQIQNDFNKGSIQYLVGTSAIERGLNLQSAGFFVNLDLPWNPAKLAQRVGRIRRIGSKHATITVYNLIAMGTIEERILKTVYEKQGLFDTIFSGKDLTDVAVSVKDLL